MSYNYCHIGNFKSLFFILPYGMNESFFFLFVVHSLVFRLCCHCDPSFSLSPSCRYLSFVSCLGTSWRCCVVVIPLSYDMDLAGSASNRFSSLFSVGQQSSLTVNRSSTHVVAHYSLLSSSFSSSNFFLFLKNILIS